MPSRLLRVRWVRLKMKDPGDHSFDSSAFSSNWEFRPCFKQVLYECAGKHRENRSRSWLLRSTVVVIQGDQARTDLGLASCTSEG